MFRSEEDKTLTNAIKSSQLSCFFGSVHEILHRAGFGKVSRGKPSRNQLFDP